MYKIASSTRGLVVGDVVGSLIEGAKVSHDNYPATMIVGHHYEEPRGDRSGEIVSSMKLVIDGCRPTDDTVLGCALIEWLMGKNEIAHCFHHWVKKYPDAGFGSRFKEWAIEKRTTIGDSWANGAAMRIAPVVDVAKSVAELLVLAGESAMATHAHREAVAGAQAIALAAYLAKNKSSNLVIKETLLSIFGRYGYNDFTTSIDELRPGLSNTSRAIDTVPVAIMAFFEASDFTDCLRKALSMGNDADTIAAMACTIAAQRWKIPEVLWLQVSNKLPEDILTCISTFEQYISSS